MPKAQAAAARELGVVVREVPPDRDSFVNALLGTVGPQALGDDTATVAKVRERIADALEHDLPNLQDGLLAPAVAPVLRRYLAAQQADQYLAGQQAEGDMTPGQAAQERERLVEELAPAARISWWRIIAQLRVAAPGASAADEIAPVLAGLVFGLRITVIDPDGSVSPIGDPAGLVVLARSGDGHWMGTAPRDEEDGDGTSADPVSPSGPPDEGAPEAGGGAPGGYQEFPLAQDAGPASGSEASADAGKPDPGPGNPAVAAPAGVFTVPWYLDHDVLGMAVVNGAGDWRAGTAASHAKAITAALRKDGAPIAGQPLGSGIEAALRDLLDRSDKTHWNKLLYEGELLAVDGHVVWLRPVLRSLRHVQSGGGRAPVSTYEVNFASTTVAVEAETAKSRGGFDILPFVSVGNAIGLPGIGGQVWDERTMGSKSLVIAGRVVFIDPANDFSADVAVRVFVDGEELVHGVVAPRELSVGIPDELSGAGAPRLPGQTAQEARPARQARTGRASRARVALTAIDLIPVVAGLHKGLLAAGMPATAVKEVSGRLQHELLNEKTARLRSELWFGGGDTSNPMNETAWPMMRPFAGNGVVGLEFDAVQFLGPGGLEDPGGSWSGPGTGGEGTSGEEHGVLRGWL